MKGSKVSPSADNPTGRRRGLELTTVPTPLFHRFLPQIKYPKHRFLGDD